MKNKVQINLPPNGPQASTEAQDAAAIKSLLQSTRTIALVGASANPERPAWGVMEALVAHGYRVFPVNPGLVGHVLHGQPVYARLSDIAVPIDIVDVFRNSDAVSGIVDEILALTTKPGTLWLQLGVHDAQAEARASASGMRVITDRCMKIELRKAGL